MTSIRNISLNQKSKSLELFYVNLFSWTINIYAKLPRKLSVFKSNIDYRPPANTADLL